eukprot:721403-Rhodomonas_salina.1
MGEMISTCKRKLQFSTNSKFPGSGAVVARRIFFVQSRAGPLMQPGFHVRLDEHGCVHSQQKWFVPSVSDARLMLHAVFSHLKLIARNLLIAMKQMVPGS